MTWSRLRDGRAPVVAVVVGAVVVAAAAGALRPGLTDLHVYQQAGRAVLDGVPTVPPRDPVSRLAFTYPPFAALVMVPLALVPFWVAAGVWAGATAAAMAAAVRLTRDALARTTPGWLAACLTCGALALEPVWQNVAFGQVNVLVMALVLLDLLRPARRWSGVLLGLVAGVKLTPLVFVVLLVLVGRRDVARRALVTLALTVAAGFVVSPRWATAYWTDGLVDAGRVGPPSLAHNQSVYGALTRLLDDRPSTLLWLAVAVPVGAAILLVARGWWRRGDRLLATGLAALAGLVASPISWSHHWVWAVPLALTLWERSRPAAVAWVAVFVARPMLWLPWGQRREYTWGPLEHVVGNAYLLAALVVCVWAARALVIDPYARRPTPGAGAVRGSGSRT